MPLDQLHRGPGNLFVIRAGPRIQGGIGLVDREARIAVAGPRHEGTPAPAAQVVPRQVAGNGVDPGGEFPGGVVAVAVAIHPEERLLNQVFCARAIAHHAVHEPDQAGPVQRIKTCKSCRIAKQVG